MKRKRPKFKTVLVLCSVVLGIVFGVGVLVYTPLGATELESLVLFEDFESGTIDINKTPLTQAYGGTVVPVQTEWSWVANCSTYPMLNIAAGKGQGRARVWATTTSMNCWAASIEADFVINEWEDGKWIEVLEFNSHSLPTDADPNRVYCFVCFVVLRGNSIMLRRAFPFDTEITEPYTFYTNQKYHIKLACKIAEEGYYRVWVDEELVIEELVDNTHITQQVTSNGVHVFEVGEETPMLGQATSGIVICSSVAYYMNLYVDNLKLVKIEPLAEKLNILNLFKTPERSITDYNRAGEDLVYDPPF